MFFSQRKTKKATLAMQIQSRNYNKGFTLIELLVVISIIALLASILLINFNTARIKARDARRIADMSQLAKQLEVCYGENGNYPTPTASWGWDAVDIGWQHVYSCSVCYGDFVKALSDCVVHPLKDPINVDPLAYYYFHFEKDAATFSGSAISPACKGRNVLMARLEMPGQENNLCFTESGRNNYFMLLGY